MKLLATIFVFCVTAGPVLAQDSESTSSIEIPSILRDLPSDQLALMSVDEKKETQGQGLEGIESLIKSRQLRYQLLRNSLLPDRR